MPIFQAGSASVPIVPDFKGAQKAIGEWFASQRDLTVGVKPDLNSADMARIRTELDLLHGTADIKVNKNKFETDLASAMSDAFKGATGLFDFGGFLTKAIKPALMVGVGGLAAELAAPLATAAEGSLALLPAVLAGIAAPLAAIKIGVSGLGQAFKDAGAGGAAFQADLAKLAPSARDFVTQVHSLAPAFDSLKLSVQQNLFAGLGAQVKQLGEVALPVMKTGLSDIASSLNLGLSATIKQLLQDGGAFTDLFANINTSVKTVATGALPIMVQDFVQIADIGSQFLPQLATGFTNLVGKFDTWLQHSIQTGQFVQLLQDALNILKQLGTLISNVFGILGDIFHAANGSGQEFLGIIVQITGFLKEMLGSVAAQNALKTFFGDLNGAVKTILPPLEQLITVLVENVLPVIGEFLKALAPVAAILGTQLANAIRTISGLFPPLADVVAGLIGAFAPLISVIGKIALAVLPPLLQVGKELIPVISALTGAFGDALLKAVQAVAPFIKPLGDAFANIVSQATPLIKLLGDMAAKVLPPLLKVIVQLAPFVEALVGTFVDLAKNLGGSLASGLAAMLRAISWLLDHLGPLKPIIEGIAVAWGVWTAAQWLLNAAMDANPLGLIITAIGLLALAIGEIITHLGFFKRIWSDIWNFIEGVAKAVVDWFTGPFLNFFTKTIPHAWETVWTAVRDFFVGIWNDISNWVQKHIIDWFTGTFVHFFTDTIPNAFKGAWNGIRDFFKGLWGDLVGWFENALGKFGTFFSKFWTDLKSGVSTIWHDIVHALEVPVQTVLNWVWNDTLRPAWNLLNNLWGGHNLDPITLPGLSAATGAVLPGWSPGTDIHHFFSPTAGFLNLSGGEAIMRPEFTAAVGAGWVNSVNAAAASGGISGVQSALGFAGGGVWPSQDWDTSNAPRGDRSTGWASDLLGAASWLVPFIPGGDLLGVLTSYLQQDARAGTNQGNNDWFNVLGGAVRTQLNHLWDFAKKSITDWFSASTKNHPKPTVLIPAGLNFGGASPTIQNILQETAALYGWQSGAEWSALLQVIQRESGFNPNAQNPHSSAYGLFQFLDGTWASVGGHKTADPILQSAYGMAYIKQRYHDPLGAEAHEQQFGWFDGGGWLPPGWSTVFNGTGQHEMVLNPDQQTKVGSKLLESSAAAMVAGIYVASGGQLITHDPAEAARKSTQGVRRSLAERHLVVKPS